MRPAAMRAVSFCSAIRLLTGEVNRQPPASNWVLGAKYHVSNSVLAVRYGLMSPNATAFAIASCRFLTPSFDSRLLM